VPAHRQRRRAHQPRQHAATLLAVLEKHRPTRLAPRQESSVGGKGDA